MKGTRKNKGPEYRHVQKRFFVTNGVKQKRHPAMKYTNKWHPTNCVKEVTVTGSVGPSENCSS